MTNSPLVYLHLPAGTDASWFAHGGGDGDGDLYSRHASLADLDDAGKFAAATVLVPGTDVLLTQARVPKARRKQVLAALPYALEDELAAEPESYHLALGSRAPGGAYGVACIDRSALDGILETLESHSIQASRIIPDVLAVPYLAGQWSLLLIDDLILVRTGTESGFATDAGCFSDYFAIALSDCGPERPQRVLVYAGDEQASKACVDVLHEADLSYQVKLHPKGDAFWWLIEGAERAGSINLLSPARRTGLATPLRPYWVGIAAALALLWMAIEIGIKFIEYRALAAQKHELSSEIEHVYRRTFPEARQVLDPRRQMEEKLQALGGAGAASSAGFLSLLDLTSRSLNSLSDFELRSLEYREGHLDVALKVGDFSHLEQIKAELRSKSGIEVEILSAATMDGHVDGRLRVRALPR